MKKFWKVLKQIFSKLNHTLLMLIALPVFAKDLQITDTIVMIYPDHFQYNAQTGETNLFAQNIIVAGQSKSRVDSTSVNISQKAMQEFNSAVEILRKQNVRVIVLPSVAHPETPDAVFPNNWFTTHVYAKQNLMILYPMFTPNRRAERQTSNLLAALKAENIKIDRLIDLSGFELQDKALEGTGSFVLDRNNKIAYASLSQRTNPMILGEFAKHTGYSIVTFHSIDNSLPIYHTNVMLSIGSKFAVISSQSITDLKERANVLASLRKSGKTIIEISPMQMRNMAANILELRTLKNKRIIVMSQTAYNSFTLKQRNQLSQFGKLVTVDIATIEKIGGGSARCMIAEVFYFGDRK